MLDDTTLQSQPSERFCVSQDTKICLMPMLNQLTET